MSGEMWAEVARLSRAYVADNGLGVSEAIDLAVCVCTVGGVPPRFSRGQREALRTHLRLLAHGMNTDRKTASA